MIGSGKASANGSLPRADRPVEAQKEESGGGTGGDMLAKDFLQLSTAVSCYLIVFFFIFCIGCCSVLDPDPLVLGSGSGSGSFYHQVKVVRKTLIS